MRALPTKEQIAELKHEIKRYDGLVKFADAIGLNKGIVSMGVNGKYLSPSLARKMGWPNPVTVPACPHCGDTAHTYDCRTEQVKPKPAERKPTGKKTLSTRQDADIIEAAIEAAGMPWARFVRWLALGRIKVK